MNQQTTPLFNDTVQIPTFALAGDAVFQRLNQTQGLSLQAHQYRYIQQHYLTKERKNPILGELLLLNRLAAHTPVADKTSPAELICHDEVIMDTWADVMQVRRTVTGETSPCTLRHVLDLPKRILIHEDMLTDGDILPYILPEGRYANAAKTSIPLLALAPQGASPLPSPVWLWTAPKRKEDTLTPLPTKPRKPKVGDVILLIPRADAASLLSVLTYGGVGNAVLDYRLAEHSVVRSALAMCEGNGLTVPMHEFISHDYAPDKSRMQAYLELYETPCPPHQCHALLRVPQPYEEGVKYMLAAHGLTAYRYGLCNKGNRLVMEYNALCLASIHRELVVRPLPPTRQSYTLPPMEAHPVGVNSVCADYLPTVGLAVASAQITLTETASEGFFAAMQAVTQAVAALASAGIPYSHVHVSPHLSFEGEEDHPLLLSAVCGLYRIATELGLPLENSDVSVSPEGTQAAKLQLTAYAYAPASTPPAQAAGDDDTDLIERLLAAVKANTSFAPIREMLTDMAKTVQQQSSEGEKACIPPHLTLPITLPTPAALKEKELQRRKEISAMEKLKAFESLAAHPRQVLLDTDIGPDCDDVGALAILIHYAKQCGFPIAGVCNCTSNKAGNALIDIVFRRLGMPTPPMGQWPHPDFMTEPQYCKYSGKVAEAFSEDYRNGTLPIEDAVTFYRRRLAAAPDGEVMMISIGMFNNLAALLESPADDISPMTGEELISAKVYAMVSMAAILPEGRECNVICDYKAAKKVFDKWPTPIYFSDFNIGFGLKTGYKHITDPDAVGADPLVMSYHLYTRDWPVVGDNDSYDLTAVQFAVLGVCKLYGLGVPGRLEFYAAVPDRPDLTDATRFIPDPKGNRIFMTLKVSKDEIAESLNKILHNI